MERKSRIRGPNFTKSENILLCDIVTKHKTIIENKKTDGANLQQKQKAWLEVVKLFNASTSGCHRTQESLQQNYKNLKRRAKQSTSDAKMNIPVDALLQNVEEFGTSPEGWENVAINVGVPEEICQKALANLKHEADRKDRILKKKVIMGTGGGPAPNNEQDPVLEKVKMLVGPAMDGMYTIYDGDSCLMASQAEAEPVEARNMETDSQLGIEYEKPTSQSSDAIIQKEDDEYCTNDRANLKKKPHYLLTRKRKLESLLPQKQSVSTKFSTLATQKLELVAMQKELLKYKLTEEKERLDHCRLIRAMELEDEKRCYEHNELMRQLELARFKETDRE